MAIQTVSSDMNAFLTTANDAAARAELGVGTGLGDVVGPASSTDNRLVTFDSTTGKLVQDDSGITAVAGAVAGVVSITGTAGNMTITAGTGNSRTLTLQSTTSGGTATAALEINATQRLVAQSLGALATPTYTFAGNLGTGMWVDPGASSALKFSYVGTNYMTLGGGVVECVVQCLGPVGSAAAPSFAPGFGDMGTYAVGPSTLGFSTAAARRVSIDSTGLQVEGADSGTPAAKTVVIGDSSRAGTDSNVGGGSGTISPGTGTGTGTAASLIFATPTPVGSGTGAQSHATRLTLTNLAATFVAPPVTPGFTVAGLAALTPVVGMRVHVTDANATLAAGIGTTVAAGGANVVPAWYNGSVWQIG